MSRSACSRNAALTLVLALAPVRAAYASPSYGGVVERTFAMPCEPTCLLCHTSEAGGYATANSKLGITLRRDPYDALCCQDDKLETILAALSSNGTDSDGDGTSDADEMRAFRNPNIVDSAAMPTELVCEPKHDSGGCTLARTSARDAALGPWTLLLVGAYLLRRRAKSAI